MKSSATAGTFAVWTFSSSGGGGGGTSSGGGGAGGFASSVQPFELFANGSLQSVDVMGVGPGVGGAGWLSWSMIACEMPASVSTTSTMTSACEVDVKLEAVAFTSGRWGTAVTTVSFPAPLISE